MSARDASDEGTGAKDSDFGPGRVPPGSVSRNNSPDLERLSDAYCDWLSAMGRKRATVESYSRSVSLLGLHLQRAGDGRSARDVTVDDLRAFAIDLLDRYAVTTVKGHVFGVRRFFTFLEASGFIELSPARNLALIRTRPMPVRVLTDTDLKRMLQACAGDEFVDRRDMALFRVFMATGARPEEVLDLKVGVPGSGASSVDLVKVMAVFMSTFGTQRRCPLDPRTVNCLNRYLSLRSNHPKRHRPDLWLTSRGRLSRGGLNGIVRSRREKAGLRGFKLHTIRSTFANHWIAGGGNEGDLMQILGVIDRRTIDRYAEGVSASNAMRNARNMFNFQPPRPNRQGAGPGMSPQNG